MALRLEEIWLRAHGGVDARERLSHEKLHHEVGRAVRRDPEVEHIPEARVAGVRRDRRLVRQHRGVVRVSAKPRQELLHRHELLEAVRAAMDAEVDHRHPSGPEREVDLAGADPRRLAVGRRERREPVGRAHERLADGHCASCDSEVGERPELPAEGAHRLTSGNGRPGLLRRCADRAMTAMLAGFVP
jgi:hypothetical protein